MSYVENSPTSDFTGPFTNDTDDKGHDTMKPITFTKNLESWYEITSCTKDLSDN